jgi:P-type Cu+ transporter
MTCLRRLRGAALAFSCAACAASQLEVGPDHPASAQAASAPLAQVGSALQPSLEPQADVAPSRHWTCPMHPEVIRKEPGNCPICGMKLQPAPTPQDPPKGSL